MKLYHVVAILLLLLSENMRQVFSKKERVLDVSSILSFFGDSDGIEESTENPDTAPRESRAQAKDKGSDKTSRKCKCEDRPSRRLKREFKDLTFGQCKHQGVGLDDEKALEITNVTISPTPLIVPGDLYIHFELEVRKKLPRHIQIDVDAYKYMFDTLPVNVPCMTVRNTDDRLSLGSCTYMNLCDYIKESACTSFKSNGLPCRCEHIPPGVYNFSTPIAVIIPSINSIFDILMKGSYQMRMAFTDSRTKKEIGCVAATWTITKLHRDKDSYRALFFKQRKTLR